MSILRRRLGVLVGLTGCLAMAAWGQTPRFERDVLPILTANCLSCHGGTSMAGLDLRTARSALKGSHNGPVIVKGNLENSLLYQRVSKREMPPPAFKQNLGDAEIETIRRWIEGGVLSDETALVAVASSEELARFEREISPIFESRCVACHGSGEPMAGLNLETLESLLKGSTNGPVILQGWSDKSILIRQVSSRAMPPPGAAEPLDETQIRTLRNWIDTARFNVRSEQAGSERETFSAAEAPPITKEDRLYWAFRKPVARPVPEVKNQSRVRTSIDEFVLSKLEAEGLSFSTDAPKVTLMRRAYLDLTGLPPTPEEIDAFLADTKPQAYERLIDRLLASPHYGERWGRHWLDAAGYTDVTGFDAGPETYSLLEGMWRYRDYVVRSFNNDKPYNVFLTEQLAGDELVDWRSAKKYTPEIVELLTATGYLRSVYDRTDADIVNLLVERYDVLFGLMEKVSTNLLGLTLGCARCHSHKYDPIPQRDYYRFLSLFTAAYNPTDWKQPKNRFLPNVSKPDEKEIARHNAEIDRPLDKLKEELARLRRPYEKRLLDTKLQELPAEIRADTKAALETAEEERNNVQEFLFKKFGEKLEVTAEEVDKVLTEEDKQAGKNLEEKIKTLGGYRRSFDKVQALWDVGSPPPIRLLQRGAVESPGPRVRPGFLTVLSPPGKSAFVRPRPVKGETSGLRLALAHWLTNRDHPLTARVMVNRIWYHHFGKGIVETVENFGRQGARPTHPALLDWLAVDFMEHGWRIKRLHKTMMTSTAYRQSSRRPASGERAAAKTADPENRLLWRMNLRRLEAEAIRDSLLAASGKLDRKTMGGPAIPLIPDSAGLQTISDENPDDKWRRSLYVLSRRNYPLSFLEVFDYPLIQTNCNRRINSSTPLQSLTQLNGPFLVEQAQHMAERVSQMAPGAEAIPKIESAYLLALSRKPSETEKQISHAHLEKQEKLYLLGNFSPEKASRMALASMCQMLLSSNELLYVE